MAFAFNNGACRSFRGDGKLDLLVRSAETGALWVYPHSGKLNGTQTYEDPVKIGDNFGRERFCFIQACDVTGNGRAELCAFSVKEVTVNGEVRKINTGENGVFGFFLLQNLGGPGEIGPFGEPTRISGKREDDRYWSTFGFADITGSGNDDIFSRGLGAGNFDCFPHLNAGVIADDTYDREPLPLTTINPDDFPFAMADFTGNGNLDLLVRRPDGDIALFEFPGKPGVEYADPASGTWYTVARGWQDMKYMTLTDVDLDGKPDLLALRPDGTLSAFVHSGRFDPDNPESLFSEPVTVGTGFDRYDTIS
ncbi:FG-GAP-like repeat-containing protein [Streptomyces reniochalinae]|uniref:VCBS repeat-containing protein n=1 Tax=Streptomyces reniochalinae TaxID=2250578 RepID=A0A367EDM9_9ACTN|nr:FG-GAP-like repeat-containing protein [Streptomyces reniochalinae]RCG16171.1 hypothetical protein DQ392_21840 [Streptomyces reniochalinae]